MTHTSVDSMANNSGGAQQAGPARTTSVSITPAISGSWHADIQYFNFKITNPDYIVDSNEYHTSNPIPINGGNPHISIAARKCKDPYEGYIGLFFYVKHEVIMRSNTINMRMKVNRLNPINIRAFNLTP